MKECCFDTSGFSNPLETMPEDIHVAIWSQVREVIASGIVAVTPEIYAELERLRGELGDCIRNNKSQMVLEVGEGSWDWHSFTTNSAAMINSYRAFISEYNGDIKGTVGMNDVSIVALAKTLRVPLVSMEWRYESWLLATRASGKGEYRICVTRKGSNISRSRSS